MRVKVTGIRIKTMPSKFGGTWSLATVKLDGYGDKKFEAQGYGSKFVEKLKDGDILIGYLGTKEYNGQITDTINKISAEYVYDLLMEMKGTPQNVVPAVPAANGEAEDDW